MDRLLRSQNYKTYLVSVLEKERGSKRKLATYLGCQPGFITQVLYGDSNFSLEHGTQICKFLVLNKLETDYFLTLLSLEKAGSAELKNYYEEKLTALRESSKDFGSQIAAKNELSIEEQNIFYSSWIYTALHVLVSVPGNQTLSEISERLELDLEEAKRKLDFLVSVGLVVFDNGKYSPGKNRIHLSRKSPLVSRHHANWRLKSIEVMDREREKDFFYSVTMGISKADSERLKTLILEFLKKTEEVIHLSKEEDLYSLNIDFFKPT